MSEKSVQILVGDQVTAFRFTKAPLDGRHESFPLGQPVELLGRDQNPRCPTVLRDDNRPSVARESPDDPRRVCLELADGYDALAGLDGLHEILRLEDDSANETPNPDQNSGLHVGSHSLRHLMFSQDRVETLLARLDEHTHAGDLWSGARHPLRLDFFSAMEPAAHEVLKSGHGPGGDPVWMGALLDAGWPEWVVMLMLSLTYAKAGAGERALQQVRTSVEDFAGGPEDAAAYQFVRSCVAALATARSLSTGGYRERVGGGS